MGSFFALEILRGELFHQTHDHDGMTGFHLQNFSLGNGKCDSTFTQDEHAHIICP